MPPKKQHPKPEIVPAEFASVEEIDRGIKKLQRRIDDLGQLNVRKAILTDNGELDVVRSDIRATIREVFGPNSPEFKEHGYIQIWVGPMGVNMDPGSIIEQTERGKVQVRTILQGLIRRLQERRGEIADEQALGPASYFDKLNLHPRIAAVANDLFTDGHHWQAVFDASKALVNLVKERSRSNLDGAPLMRAVFSRNAPVLAFNDLADQTQLDEQEGMMHLFEGAILAIRNPGGHAFPEGPEQRALEYISFLSLLAYRVDETKRVK
jgi:uncharacterized protein (TIGR02391 family)